MKLGIVYLHALGRGGYPRDVRWLASALANYGLAVTLFCREPQERKCSMEGLVETVCIEDIDSLVRSDADIYHVLGIFIPMQLWKLRYLLNKPVVVSPMGHLMPFHLQRRAVKKAIFLKIAKPILKRVSWYHVFSSIEAGSVYRYLGQEVHIFEASLGIDILLKGFAKVVKRGANATLTIAGRPWGNSERYIREFIEKGGLGKQVRVLGPVDEAVKWKLLSEADYLVFLSRWDGPPRPIREAIFVSAWIGLA